MKVLEQMHSHRSIRRYQPDPVSEETLREILEGGIRASSSGNMQAYSIIVTRDQELREQLLNAHFQQSMVLEAPVLLTFCADFNRMRRWLTLNNAPDNFDNLFSFLIGAIDALLVSQNVALAAESKGLGICYLGSTLSNADQIRKILQLPANVVPAAGFTLGHPAEDPDRRDRLPLDGLIHQETYQPYSDRDIKEIYREREIKGWERYLQSARLRSLVEEAGVTNLAELYTRVKYTRKSYQEISRRLLRTLEEAEFMHHSPADNG